MAQQTITSDGLVLTVPGTYVTQKVISGQTGIPTSGVVALVGEAAEGPGFSQETDLNANIFGPDQFDAVIQKYGSGRLVDAYRSIVAPSSDPQVAGAPASIRIIKTNASTKASAILTRSGIADYALLAAIRGGDAGNLIRYKSEVAQSEIAPAILLKAYTPLYSGSTTGCSININGASNHAFTLSAGDDVAAFAAAVGSVTNGIMVSGGASVASLSGKAGLALTASVQSTNLKITLATGQVWAAVPAIGSTVIIPAAGSFGAVVASCVKGASNGNIGSYVVLSVTNTASNASMTLKPVNVAGPIEAASGVIDSGEKDLVLWEQISIYNITGQARTVSSGTANWTTINDGTNVSITSSVALVGKPSVGDILKLTAAFAGIQPGFYSVTGSTSTTISCFRMSYGSAGTSGSASAVVAGFTVLKSTIDGTGKSMETFGDYDAFLRTSAGAVGDAGDTFYISSAEYINRMTLTQGTTTNTIEAGGDIIVRIGSTSATASVQVTSSSMIITDTNGTLTFSFDTILTLADLVASINAQSGWSASIGSSKFNFLSPKTLDQATYGASSISGYEAARIKYDAFDWASEMASSTLISSVMAATAGLPEVLVPFNFLSGGLRGGTTGADVIAAVEATKDLTLNFLVPLFSADATTDIASGETSSSSTYTIDAINAACKSNVISSSAVKSRANRQAFLSRVGTFAEQQEAAGDLASFRCSLSFQDVRNLSASGLIVSYQPWMAAVIASGMQAAAGYRGIVKKFANIAGLFHADGSYNARSYSQKETALKAGLLPLESVNTGGFRFVSDQTTYTLDSNFVFNSIQAVYLADLMTLSLIDAFDKVVVGQSVAEVSAAAALSFLQGQMYNFYRLKWIATSNDAPLGYKNASVRLVGGVMTVTVEAKLAGLIYFVPITLSISEVTQEAVQ